MLSCNATAICLTVRLSFFSNIQSQTQGFEEITEEDLQLIQDRESAIKQLEVRHSKQNRKMITKFQYLNRHKEQMEQLLPKNLSTNYQ